jgi:hypothetical protein
MTMDIRVPLDVAEELTCALVKPFWLKWLQFLPALAKLFNPSGFGVVVSS